MNSTLISLDLQGIVIQRRRLYFAQNPDGWWILARLPEFIKKKPEPYWTSHTIHQTPFTSKIEAQAWAHVIYAPDYHPKPLAFGGRKFGATNQPGTCLFCGKKLNRYSHDHSEFGGNGDNAFCSKEHGYLFGTQIAALNCRMESKG